LVSGEAEYLEREKVANLGETITEYRKKTKIPLVGRVAAGSPLYFFEDVLGEKGYDVAYEIDEFLYYQHKRNYRDQVVFVQIKGESMMPHFGDGDLALVERLEDPALLRHGDIGVFSIREEWTMKRINLRAESDRVLLEPLNAAFETMSVKHSVLKIYGIVIGAIRLF
jgi:SOS-response transcriptional repressor LexA